MTDEKEQHKEQPATEKKYAGSRGDHSQSQKSTESKNKTGANSIQSNYSDAKTPRKVYFQEELKRLRQGLEREGSKIKKPTRKAYTPYTFTSLEPYYNTATQSRVIDHEPKEPKGYVPRKTAIGLCDPWVDLNMDVELLPRPVEKEEETSPGPGKGASHRSKRGHVKAEGSTRLPKFPAVQMPTLELAAKPLHYGDVPHLREELKNKYGSRAVTKVNEEYERTRNDFYRMDLNRLDEYHPTKREHMTQVYMAYLQNNPGSKKAVKECIEEAKKDLEESIASSRPHSAVSRPLSAVSVQPVSEKTKSSQKIE